VPVCVKLAGAQYQFLAFKRSVDVGLSTDVTVCGIVAPEGCSGYESDDLSAGLQCTLCVVGLCCELVVSVSLLCRCPESFS